MIVRVFAVLTACVIALTLAAAWWGNRWLHEPLSVDEPTTFEILPGSAFVRVADDLGKAGIIEHPLVFSWYARLVGSAGKVHAGEYQISADSTPAALLEKFVAGDVRLHSFTIVEGWTFRELLAALATDDVIQGDLHHEDWPAIAEALDTDYDDPEGLFLPETYRVPRGTTDLELLRQANALLISVLETEWAARAEDLPLSNAYEALILASIIEKETALASERPKIAGVFVRRLQQNMRLQTDPTVIYGVGEAFDGDLTRQHLRTDTPYNTYTRYGLPPGPIALPGQAAIHAAVNPADGNELFFVATGLADGSHKFTATREAHEAAVAEYLQRLRNPDAAVSQ